MSKITATRRFDDAIELLDDDIVYMYVSPEEVIAIKDLLVAERDAELGRWRDPVEPDFVAYLYDLGLVAVIDETNGLKGTWTRDELEDRRWDSEITARVAKRFFEAHPERKPWHDAKPGSLWAITISGKTYGMTATDYGTFEAPGIKIRSTKNDPAITKGECLWTPAEEQ